MIRRWGAAGLVAMGLLAAGAASAAPTLLGDTISILRAYPLSGTPYGPAIPDTTVTAGNSDLVTWASSAPATFDPEATSILVTFQTVTGYIGSGATFDGYVISGLDHDIASVSVLGNSSGLAVDLTHDARNIFIDLTGTTISNGTLSLSVLLADTTPAVPEPTTPALVALAAGLAALSGRRRPTRPPARPSRTPPAP